MTEDKMEFSILTQHQAEDIAYNWRYEGIYSFYNMTANLENLQDFLHKKKRAHHVLAVTQYDQLIGFVQLQPVNQHVVEIGLGLKPSLTGQGIGITFLQAILHYIKHETNFTTVTLAVAAFNQRAIITYERVGFIKQFDYTVDIEGTMYDYLHMLLTFH